MSDPASRRQIARLLGRIAFAPNAADIDDVLRCGFAAHVDAQLAWRSLDDGALEASLGRALPTLALDRAALVARRRAASDASARRRAEIEWRAATRARRGASRRQLYETMVAFWTRRFGLADGIDAVLHDRDVVREHALGRYGDLLKASARSAAMLGRDRREWLDDLLRRYTRGSHAGCGDGELDAMLRCFSGWEADPATGRLRFDAARHDFGAKQVLGLLQPAGYGVEDGDTVIDCLVAHPSTARHIASGLVRRFLGSEPRELVDVVALVFGATRGDIASTLRAIVGSVPFLQSVGLDAAVVARG